MIGEESMKRRLIFSAQKTAALRRSIKDYTIDKIKSACLSRDLIICEVDAKEVWKEYSLDQDCKWASMPEFLDELYDIVIRYCSVEEQ